jgi:hypothetical protein
MNKLHTRIETLKMLRSKEFALHVIALVERTAAAHFASATLMDDSIVTGQKPLKNRSVSRHQQ